VISSNLKFSKRTCFVLTEAGYRALQSGFDRRNSAKSLRRDGPSVLESKHPKWNETLHELTCGRDIIKRFRQSSPNQEAILTAFEEAGWPSEISDPLPSVAGVKRKKRLQETIRSLNANQKHNFIQFTVGDSAHSVHWQWRVDKRTNRAVRAPKDRHDHQE
jgi:hypothetical protein